MPLITQIVARGLEAYDASFQAMRAYTDARTEATPDQIWIVEHPPVFTLGLAADRGHLLAGDHAIPVVETDRGGEVTYHGPGQVVIYLLLDLRRRGKNGRMFARDLVFQIEQAIIDVLAAYNLAGVRKDGAPGIYVASGPQQGAKIAALGLKIRGNGCTYHGLSLNVAMDLAPFSLINPCGYQGLACTDMRSLGAAVALAEVQQALAMRLAQQLAPAAQAPISPNDLASTTVAKA